MGTPSEAASFRAEALSPIARIALGGGPIQRMPAASTASAKSAFSARNPKPGWMASAVALRAAATTPSMSSRSTAPPPSVGGVTARIPSRLQVRVIRDAISPRFAMKRVAIPSGVSTGDAAATNASIASIATRQRPPTRRAGSRPAAIHLWTDRVVAPTRAAASLGLSSSDMTVAIVAYHGREGTGPSYPRAFFARPVPSPPHEHLDARRCLRRRFAHFGTVDLQSVGASVDARARPGAAAVHHGHRAVGVP